MSHRQEDSAFEKTASWINNTASAVGDVIKTRRSSGDEQQPLLGVDEEMGLVSSLNQPSSRGRGHSPFLILVKQPTCPLA